MMSSDKKLEIQKQVERSRVHHCTAGTTMFFGGMSARPEYNSKVKAMFALGPVATVNHILSPIRFLAPLSREIEVRATLLKLKDETFIYLLLVL